MNNENWVTTENVTAWRKEAMKYRDERQKYEKGKRFKMIPHPTSPRALIMKPI